MDEICQALGLRVSDLFDDVSTPRGSRPRPKPRKLDRVAVAFQFDLGALDLRLRAQKFMEAAKGSDVAALDEGALDRALACIAQAC